MLVTISRIFMLSYPPLIYQKKTKKTLYAVDPLGMKEGRREIKLEREEKLSEKIKPK